MGINCNYRQCRVIDMKNQPLRIVSESNLSKTLQFIPAHYNYPPFVKKIRNRQTLFPLLLALMNEPPPPLLHRFASEITKNHNHQVAAWKTWANRTLMDRMITFYRRHLYSYIPIVSIFSIISVTLLSHWSHQEGDGRYWLYKG